MPASGINQAALIELLGPVTQPDAGLTDTPVTDTAE